MVKTRSGDSATAKSSAPRGKEAQASQSRRYAIIHFVISIISLGLLSWVWDNVAVPQLGLNRLHVHSLSDRVIFTVRHQLPGLLAILISVLHVSLTRAFTLAVNPLSGNEHLVEVGNRVLQNTVEQYLLTAVNQLILATHVTEAHLRFIPLISVTFLIGRILFLVGYIRSPNYRGLGFNLSFLPVLAMTAANIYYSTTLGYSHHLGTTFGSARG